jgi:hypothetical protein
VRPTRCVVTARRLIAGGTLPSCAAIALVSVPSGCASAVLAAVVMLLARIIIACGACPLSRAAARVLTPIGTAGCAVLAWLAVTPRGLVARLVALPPSFTCAGVTATVRSALAAVRAARIVVAARGIVAGLIICPPGCTRARVTASRWCAGGTVFAWVAIAGVGGGNGRSGCGDLARNSWQQRGRHHHREQRQPPPTPSAAWQRGGRGRHHLVTLRPARTPPVHALPHGARRGAASGPARDVVCACPNATPYYLDHSERRPARLRPCEPSPKLVPLARFRRAGILPPRRRCRRRRPCRRQLCPRPPSCLERRADDIQSRTQ